MKIRVCDLRLPLEFTERDLMKRAARRLNINRREIRTFTLVRKAIDARRETVTFTCTVDLDLPDSLDIPDNILRGADICLLEPEAEHPLIPGGSQLQYSPIIVGSGPAGLFCALFLARNGYSPVIFEQGEDIDRRVKAVENFWREGCLNPRSNIQFGEGGAGTFSDGKLTTRIGDERINYVLKTFVTHGADPEILYLKKPHIGTDVIRRIIKEIRREIISLGGQVYFDAQMTDLNIDQKSLKSIIINDTMEIPCSLAVVAVGNSARQAYRILNARGVTLTPKAFAIGVRVEHPQEMIDRAQYADFAGHPLLGAADYHLTYQDRVTGRSMYTFCMCPGGYVIGAASEPGLLVTNGMSYQARTSGVANSALVVTVKPEDWNYSTLGGMLYQQELEKRAFIMGGANYHAPGQFLTDFLKQMPSTDLAGSLATFKPGLQPVDLWKLMPPDICGVMQRGIEEWNRKLKGFISEKTVLTAIETRTSAPVRIERNVNMSSTEVGNLYPAGEGAGYAGGIMSAAVDGLKIAEQIIRTYCRPREAGGYFRLGLSDGRYL